MRKNLSIKTLILFLLLSQFATFLHASEHQLIPDDHIQCLICVHANDNNNAITHSPLLTQLVPTNYEKSTFNHIKYGLKSFTLFSIRSPPTFS